MPSSPLDPFDRLCAGLLRDGYQQEARQLHDLIHGTAWTTGSELLGELGVAIRQIKSRRLKGLSPQTRKDIAEALATVRCAWPGLPR